MPISRVPFPLLDAIALYSPACRFLAELLAFLSAEGCFVADRDPLLFFVSPNRFARDGAPELPFFLCDGAPFFPDLPLPAFPLPGCPDTSIVIVVTEIVEVGATTEAFDACGKKKRATNGVSSAIIILIVEFRFFNSSVRW